MNNCNSDENLMKSDICLRLFNLLSISSFYKPGRPQAYDNITIVIAEDRDGKFDFKRNKHDDKIKVFSGRKLYFVNYYRSEDLTG